MPSDPNRFDKEALTWDSKAETVQTSQALYEALLQRLPELHDAAAQLKVLDLGCGTGLLSQRLAQCPGVASIVGVDTSKGMIDVFNSKQDSRPNGQKMKGIIKLLEDPNDPILQGQKFDLAVTHLALHHIPDMGATVRTLAGTLVLGGRVLLSDFENDGSHAVLFHAKHKHHSVERHGITRDEMRGILEKAGGLTDVNVDTSFALPKTLPDGTKTDFPFLLGSATRSYSQRC